MPLPMTDCHTEIHKRHVSLHMSPRVSTWSMGGKSWTSILGVKVFCGARACLCLVRKSRSLVCKHSRAETARKGIERSMKRSENEIERGREGGLVNRKLFRIWFRGWVMFLQGKGGQAFPKPEFWNGWSVVPKDWAESGTDKAAMGFPLNSAL